MPPLDHHDHDERPLEPQRLERLEALLARGLERRTAPSELSDRVRAALSNGEAAEEARLRPILARLDRLRTPAELQARVAMTVRSDDAELERRAERLGSRLTPMSAPAELRERVQVALSNGEVAEEARLRPIFAGLDRLQSPAELQARVAMTLRSDDAELERRAERLGSRLTPMPAPAELRERVQLELGTELSVASTLRGLERQSAPHVLERLVDEEICDDKAVAKRFIGSLPKPGAPSDLDLVAHTAANDFRHSNPIGGLVLDGPWRRVIAAAALLLAAGSIAWIVIEAPGDRGDSGDRDGADLVERPTFRLQGRQVASIEEFNPMARGLAEGLGVLDVVDRLSNESPTTDGGGR